MAGTVGCGPNRLWSDHFSCGRNTCLPQPQQEHWTRRAIRWLGRSLDESGRRNRDALRNESPTRPPDSAPPASVPPPTTATEARSGVVVASYMSTVLFGNDQYTVTPAMNAELSRFVSANQLGPADTVMVDGYASTPGSRPHNLTLSQNRANAVRDVLVRLGYPRDRIVVTAHGEDQPITDSSGREDTTASRRAYVNILRVTERA